MALIQNPSIGRKLQQLLRLTSLPDTVLSPETVPVILVEDVSDPLLGDGRGCMGTARRNAVAAENAIVVLVRVGAPASYRLKVTKVWFSSPTTQRLILAVPTAGVLGLTPSGSTSFRDFNLPGRPASQLGTDTQVAIPARRDLWSGLVLANTTIVLPVNIDIGTIGQADDLTSLMIVANTQNTDIDAGFEWVEDAPKG